MRLIRRLLIGLTVVAMVCALPFIILVVVELSGLPSVDALAVYLPLKEVDIPPQQCVDASIHAVPLQSALHFKDALLASTGKQHNSVQIARTLMCGQRRNNLRRELDEILLSLRIETHFNPDERDTIYLNRVYLGEGQFGIGSATQHYFHCRTSEAGLPEQALLMAMPSSASRYSPVKHPEQALARRNAILASMFERGSISVAQQQSAQSAPLLEQAETSR